MSPDTPTTPAATHSTTVRAKTTGRLSHNGKHYPPGAVDDFEMAEVSHLLHTTLLPVGLDVPVTHPGGEQPAADAPAAPAPVPALTPAPPSDTPTTPAGAPTEAAGGVSAPLAAEPGKCDACSDPLADADAVTRELEAK